MMHRLPRPKTEKTMTVIWYMHVMYDVRMNTYMTTYEYMQSCKKSREAARDRDRGSVSKSEKPASDEILLPPIHLFELRLQPRRHQHALLVVEARRHAAAALAGYI